MRKDSNFVSSFLETVCGTESVKHSADSDGVHQRGTHLNVYRSDEWRITRLETVTYESSSTRIAHEVQFGINITHRVSRWPYRANESDDIVVRILQLEMIVRIGIRLSGADGSIVTIISAEFPLGRHRYVLPSGPRNVR